MPIIYFDIGCLRPDHLACCGYDDMAADPYQTLNPATQEPQLTADMSGSMTAWVQEQMTKPHWVSDPLSEILRERDNPTAG